MGNCQASLNSENWQEMPNHAEFKRQCGAEFSALVFSVIFVRFVLVCVFVTTLDVAIACIHVVVCLRSATRLSRVTMLLSSAYGYASVARAPAPML